MVSVPSSITQIEPMANITKDDPPGLRGKLPNDEDYSLEYPTTRLCSLCRKIFDHWTDIIKVATADDRRGDNRKMDFQHHQSKSALTESASHGCGLCIQFARNLSAGNWDETSGSSVEVYSQFGRNWRLRLHSSHPKRKRQQFCYSTLQMFSTATPAWRYCDRSIPSGSTEAALPLCKAWLSDCLQTHKHCSAISEVQVPTRLIFIGEVKPRLCLSAGILGAVAYATLSHCWGAKKFLTLKKTNITVFQRHIPAEAITKTFYDAIAISRYLGLQYLWIDSLCIVQDDPDDWFREAGLMESVYGGSTVNLAASSACDGNVGCFFDRPGSWRCQFKADTSEIQRARLSESESFSDCVPQRLNTLVGATPLSQRAWAVQERILAPRNLYFTNNEVFWECTQKSACETFPDGLPGEMVYRAWASSPPKEDSTIEFPAPWFNIVMHYSRCNLSKSEDKLVAIAGVARRWQSRVQQSHVAGIWDGPLAGEYVAGLWRGHLPLGLCWKVDSPKKRLHPYTAPTWSWASLDGMVLGPSIRWKHANMLVKVQEISVTHASTDVFGAISTATLHLACKSLICAGLESRRPVKSKSAVYTIYVSDKEVGGEVKLDIEPAFVGRVLDIYILPVMFQRFMATKCLILNRIDGTEGRYERLGLATWSDKSSIFKPYLLGEAPYSSPDCVLEDKDYIDTFKDADGSSHYVIDIV
ncbi:HET-domain-containing protein [Acephala macrosclerotiorum]|nr:HET-domain-containing protein [Acephala macrosclerotiorum]